MANIPTRFQVDSRIGRLLSEEYTSTEQALKELIDNAWDADAGKVEVSFPKPMTSDPIVILDNGTGMSSDSLKKQYLKIAADRRVHRGPKTPVRQRIVKGRKGIGKFAGLMAAGSMTLTTWCKGTSTSFTLTVNELMLAEDIEKLDINLVVDQCDMALTGTQIVLENLHSDYPFPDPIKFKQILLKEYGRNKEIGILIDGKPLDIDDVLGEYSAHESVVDGVGPVKLRFTIAHDSPVTRKPGLTILVDGKPVGPPTYMGLDSHEDIPPKLLRRLYGEVVADGLTSAVTEGWDGLVKDSVLLDRVVDYVKPILYAAFKAKHGRQLGAAAARITRRVNATLATLPAHRRAFADKAIQKIITKFYGESDEKIEAFVHVLLEAIERDDYGTVLSHLADAPRSDISAIAECLEEFGMADIAHVARQAAARLQTLDHLEQMALDKKTLEAQMHKAFETNLWILGAQYLLFTSNRTLQKTVEDQLGRKYKGRNAKNRPDLLATDGFHDESLLIEFKRPSHALKLEDYTQALEYRHELKLHISKKMSVLIIGGSRSPGFPTTGIEEGVKSTTFLELIGIARKELEWRLKSQPA
jgi:hypothetical protein